MAISKSEIFKAVSSLTKGVMYPFANVKNNNCLEFVNSDKERGLLFKRYIPGGDTKFVSVTTRNLEKLASKIRPYVPFSIDVVVGASGNWRSLFESALALTPNFFICHINNQRRLIYAPEHTHEVGICETLTPLKFDEFNKQSRFYDFKFFLENCYPFENCYQSFMSASAKMPKLFREANSQYFSLFECEDIEALKQIILHLNAEKPNLLMETTSDPRFSMGDVLKAYILFLRAKENYSFY